MNARVGQFMQLAKLSFQDASMTEYSIIAKAVEFGLQKDQLMVCNLVAFELLVRRFQSIEEKYRFRLPQFESSKPGLRLTTIRLFSWFRNSVNGWQALCLRDAGVV